MTTEKYKSIASKLKLERTRLFSEGDIKTPFGGYKQSGSLSRDQGTESLNQYLQTKTIWISHS